MNYHFSFFYFYNLKRSQAINLHLKTFTGNPQTQQTVTIKGMK